MRVFTNGKTLNVSVPGTRTLGNIVTQIVAQYPDAIPTGSSLVLKNGAGRVIGTWAQSSYDSSAMVENGFTLEVIRKVNAGSPLDLNQFDASVREQLRAKFGSEVDGCICVRLDVQGTAAASKVQVVRPGTTISSILGYYGVEIAGLSVLLNGAPAATDTELQSSHCDNKGNVYITGVKKVKAGR